MEPRLRGGDLILVDRAQDAVRNGQLYVVRAGNDVLVKIIARAAPDQLTLVSTNPVYPPRTISEADAATGFTVIGPVIASMAEGGSSSAFGPPRTQRGSHPADCGPAFAKNAPDRTPLDRPIYKAQTPPHHPASLTKPDAPIPIHSDPPTSPHPPGVFPAGR